MKIQNKSQFCSVSNQRFRKRGHSLLDFFAKDGTSPSDDNCSAYVYFIFLFVKTNSMNCLLNQQIGQRLVQTGLQLWLQGSPFQSPEENIFPFVLSDQAMTL